MKPVTALSTIIRAQAGGPAIILDDRLLNPAVADEMVAGAHFVHRLAQTGDALDHELFFVNWAMTAAPSKESDKLRAFYLAQQSSSRTEHPLDSTTYVQRDRIGQTSTLSVVFEGNELDPTDPDDTRKAAVLIRELERIAMPNSATVMGDAHTFFSEWVIVGNTLAHKCSTNDRRELVQHIDQLWIYAEPGKRRARIAEPDDEPAKASRPNRPYGHFVATNDLMGTQLELIRAKGKLNVINVLVGGRELDNSDYDDWAHGAVVIKNLHDKHDGFYDGMTMFRDWSTQGYTPDQVADWEEHATRVYECALEAATRPGKPRPNGTIAMPSHILDTSAPCAPCAQGPQVGQTWWCMMPSKSRNTLQQMTITYISDKRVELLIAGRQNNSTNLANYRRDDIEFVEVVQ